MGSSKNCHRRIWKLSTNLCSGFYTSLGLREKSDSSENSKAPRLGLAPGGVLAQLLRKRRREPQATRLPGSQNAKTGGSAPGRFHGSRNEWAAVPEPVNDNGTLYGIN